MMNDAGSINTNNTPERKPLLRKIFRRQPLSETSNPNQPILITPSKRPDSGNHFLPNSSQDLSDLLRRFKR